MEKGYVEFYRKITGKWYWSANEWHHPDVGGRDEDMVALTEAFRWLERSILQGGVS